MRSTSGAAAAAAGADADDEAAAGVEELAAGLLFSKTLVFFVTTRSSCCNGKKLVTQIGLLLTGAEFYHLLIADKNMVPSGHSCQSSSKLLILGHTYQTLSSTKYCTGGGKAQHRGSIRTSHPAVPGLVLVIPTFLQPKNLMLLRSIDSGTT